MEIRAKKIWMRRWQNVKRRKDEGTEAEGCQQREQEDVGTTMGLTADVVNATRRKEVISSGVRGAVSPVGFRADWAG